VQCPELTNFTNGTVNGGSRTAGATRTYSCTNGFGISGSATNRTVNTVCQESGTWTVSPPTCTDINECTQLAVCNSAGNTCVNLINGAGYRCDCAATWLGSSVTNGNASCTQCGNGTVNAGEQCDNGAQNGVVPLCEAQSCNYCTTSCTVASVMPTNTSCGDFLDNDGDLLTDCPDADCGGVGSCPNWSCRNTTTGTMPSPTPVIAYINNAPPGTVGQVVTDVTANTTGRPRSFDPWLRATAPGSVAWMWRAPASAVYRFSLCAAPASSAISDTVLGIYNEAQACGQASTIGRLAAADDTGCGSAREAIDFSVTAGTNLIIAAAAWGSVHGNIRLQVIRQTQCPTNQIVDCNGNCTTATLGGSCDVNLSCAALNFDSGACRCFAVPANGSASPPNPNPGTASSFFCNAGFNRSGVASGTCQTNGQYNVTLPACVRNPNYCGPPPAAGSNAALTVAPADNGLGSVAQYGCSSGSRDNGDTSRTCTTTGWSGSALNCSSGGCTVVAASPASPRRTLWHLGIALLVVLGAGFAPLGPRRRPR
jgi:CUB/sushi domain-containing protein